MMINGMLSSVLRAKDLLLLASDNNENVTIGVDVFQDLRLMFHEKKVSIKNKRLKRSYNRHSEAHLLSHRKFKCQVKTF